MAAVAAGAGAREGGREASAKGSGYPAKQRTPSELRYQAALARSKSPALARSKSQPSAALPSRSPGRRSTAAVAAAAGSPPAQRPGSGEAAEEAAGVARPTSPSRPRSRPSTAAPGARVAAPAAVASVAEDAAAAEGSPTARCAQLYLRRRTYGFRSDWTAAPASPSSSSRASRPSAAAQSKEQSDAKVQEHLVEKWKKQKGCPKDARVFGCTVMAPAMREELLSRGWFQNNDPKSNIFDLRWTSSNPDFAIIWSELKAHQIVNTQEDDTSLTTKYGLTRTLRHAQRLVGVSSETFYPRAFCLQDPTERMSWMADFRLSKAEAVLEAYLHDAGRGHSSTFSDEVVEAALDLCATVTEYSCEDMVKPDGKTIELGSHESWRLLQSADLHNPAHAMGVTKDSSSLQAQVEGSYRRKWSLKVGADGKEGTEKRASLASAPAAAAAAAAASAAPLPAEADQPLPERAREALRDRDARRRGGPPMRGQNTWIVKPTCRARGEGIEVMQDMGLILKRACRDAFRWIAQKYIERPQLVRGYKFDIRQWVLVTNWKPLTVYIWKQPFLRFAFRKYDENVSDLSKFVHLTNNSPIKGTEEFTQEHETLKTKGFMWYRQQYEAWLHKAFCKKRRHCTPWLVPPPYKSWEEGHVMSTEAQCMECGSSQASTSTGGSCGGSASSSASPRGPASGAAAGGGEGSQGLAACAVGEDEGSRRQPNPAGRDAVAASLDRCPSGGQDTARRRSFADAVAEAVAGPGGASGIAGADTSPQRTRPAELLVAAPVAPAAFWELDEPAAAAAAVPSELPAPGELGPEPTSHSPDETTAEEKPAAKKHASFRATGPCTNLFESCIMPQIKDIVSHTLQCGADRIKGRRNACSILGFDLMVSQDETGAPKVWLLEVNKRPDFSYSTPIKYALVRKMFKDTATVILDMPENPDTDIGEWELLC